MSIKTVTTSASAPRIGIIYIHLLGLIIPIGYGIYHFLYGSLAIAILSVIIFLNCACSLLCILRNKKHNTFFLLYVISVIAALSVTSYYHGYRGIILLFPFIAGLFYELKTRAALVSAFIASFSCIIPALNVLAPADVIRCAFALLISIGVAMCYTYIINKQTSTLEKDANHDELTGISNRRHFSQWLNSITNKQEKHFQNIALFYLDIDNFKEINDAHGHVIGDRLLISFSERIANLVRESDIIKSNATTYNFARLSGDEFVLAIIDLDSEESINTICHRLLEHTALPFRIGSSKFNIHVSVGVAFSEKSIDGESLLHKADCAMYQAKKMGKHTFHVFDNRTTQEIIRKKDIETEIINNLKDETFNLGFMPIYETENPKNMVGAEVLLRYNEKSSQPFELETMIATAEESQLIIEIDHWVIENTFKRLSSLEKYSPLSDIWFAINISSAELVDDDFIRRIKILLEKYRIDANRIHLEITETKLVPYKSNIIERLKSLKQLGFHLALDDYGTGYTGFSQLLNFPGSHIKIDRSFISSIGKENDKHEKMIEIILSIAKTCHLEVVAEGVETQKQLHYLRNRQCQYVQGYYLSKPLSWEKLSETIK